VELLREEGLNGEMQLSPLSCTPPPTFIVAINTAKSALGATYIYAELTTATMVNVTVHDPYTTLHRNKLLPRATDTTTNRQVFFLPPGGKFPAGNATSINMIYLINTVLNAILNRMPTCLTITICNNHLNG
jgi:hypothetical protein